MNGRVGPVAANVVQLGLRDPRVSLGTIVHDQPEHDPHQTQQTGQEERRIFVGLKLLF